MSTTTIHRYGTFVTNVATANPEHLIGNIVGKRENCDIYQFNKNY